MTPGLERRFSKASCLFLTACGLCWLCVLGNQPAAAALQPQPQPQPKDKADKLTPVVTVTDTDDVYSRIDSDVLTQIPVTPSVVSPLDTMKLQINTRMNGGLMSGNLTNDDADIVRSMLDAVSEREAEFKLEANGCLSQPQINNLMRKYHMVGQRLDYYLSNDLVTYMPSFELRRAGLQRRIHYHVAAGDITPVEGEQLLNALSAISDNYNSYRATGGALTASELESLHRDLSLVFAKLSERCGAKLAFVSPPSHNKLAELKQTIALIQASKQFSKKETEDLQKQYADLAIMQESLSKCEGLHSADLVMLAKQIDDLNFVLTRELRDRQIAGRSNKL